MQDIEKVLDETNTENILITETAKNVKKYIEQTWKNLDVELEIPLKNIFPDPGKGGLKTIWQYGAADIVVKKNKKILAIFEPGGYHHFTDEKQIRRDKRKWKLCQINGVKCFRFSNDLFGKLSKRKTRAMFGKYLFDQK